MTAAGKFAIPILLISHLSRSHSAHKSEHPKEQIAMVFVTVSLHSELTQGFNTLTLKQKEGKWVLGGEYFTNKCFTESPGFLFVCHQEEYSSGYSLPSPAIPILLRYLSLPYRTFPFSLFTNKCFTESPGYGSKGSLIVTRKEMVWMNKP